MKTVEEVIAGVLGIDAASISDSATPDDIEQWDSFNALLLVSELEKNFRVNFSFEEVTGVKNIGDIKKLLKKHNVRIP